MVYIIYGVLFLLGFIIGQLFIAFRLCSMSKREFIELINDLRDERFVSYSD